MVLITFPSNDRQLGDYILLPETKSDRLNSGTAAALVLARRSFRFSERLPRCLNALLQPVDCNRHVWHYWARTSKLLKGCHRHSFFNVRVRFGVKPSIQSSSQKRKIDGIR